MNVELTSQERVNRMFARQDQDRIPRSDSYWNETLERWGKEGLEGGWGGAIKALRGDILGLNWIWPECFPGRQEILSEDAEIKTFIDGQGKTLRVWKNKMGTPEHLGFDCDTREKWETRYKPALLKTGLQCQPQEVVRKYADARKAGVWCHLTSVEPFEEIRAVLGDEMMAIAMGEDPDWIRDIGVTFVDNVLMNLDAVMATGITPDGLWIYGDMAYNHSTFCSPAMYKELIWPEHKRLADWAHAHRMKMIFHTDGKVHDVIPLWIEAGFDAFQPIEAKADMDIRTLCPKYGDKLAMFGNIDAMVLATNDLDQIEAEVRSKLAAGMATKGYIYHSDHSVPPEVSWKTYLELIRMLDQYGVYA